MATPQPLTGERIVTSCTQGIAPSVNSCPLNNGLLFQFILSDFLAVFLNVQHLQSLYPLPSSDMSYDSHNQKLINQIEDALDYLIGSRANLSNRFSSHFKEGILTRLKTHCTHFSQQADNEEKELLAMQHYADKAWQNCLLAADALRDAPNQCTKLFTLLEKAASASYRLAKLIARVILQFQDDENVLFFVLRHKEQFDKAYGKRFITKLFCRMYPKGLREAEHFLVSKYMSRSFDNMTPIIMKLFTELNTSNL